MASVAVLTNETPGVFMRRPFERGAPKRSRVDSRPIYLHFVIIFVALSICVVHSSIFFWPIMSLAIFISFIAISFFCASVIFVASASIFAISAPVQDIFCCAWTGLRARRMANEATLSKDLNIAFTPVVLFLGGTTQPRKGQDDIWFHIAHRPR